MGNTRSALRMLAELEWRYDGPIPEPLRRAAEFGGLERAQAVMAEGQAGFFTSLIHRQVVALRRTRADDAARRRLLADLALYRRRRRFWRDEARRWASLTADGVTPSVGDAP